MASRKVAVVTGGNKGIGFAIVKGLCENFDGDVYLTARNVKRGQDAVEELQKLGFHPLFYQLNITDQKSVTAFREYLETKHKGLDLLINNAAIAGIHDTPDPPEVQAKGTLEVNYYGTKRVCEALFPLLRKNARVVNISSSSGHLSRLPSAELRAQFNDEDLTVKGLDALMEQYVRDTAEGKREENGWVSSYYVVSKVGVSALTKIQQKLFDSETPYRNISVNSVHPGYVSTDMTNYKGVLTPDEGARAPLFLALKANLKGKYVWKNCKVIDWDAETLTETY